jgi:hypothetical protein
MHVDFKITTWERVEIPEGKEPMVRDLIKNGLVESASDLFDHLDDITCEKLTDVDEQMTPEENGGCSTIEIWEGVKNIWENGKEE